MNPTEYEKLCNEAFGKPEKPDLWTILKRNKKPLLCLSVALILVVAVLTAFALRNARSDQLYPKPVWLTVIDRSETGLRGRDVEGNIWIVNGDTDNLWENTSSCWISFDGEPEKPEHSLSGLRVDYVVNADRCWNFANCDQVLYANDACRFDVDRDGVLEQCVVTLGVTGLLTYDLTVWDGDTLEAQVFFYAESNMPAFYIEDGCLKLLGYGRETLTSSYQEYVYDIAFEDGKLKVTLEGEPVQIMDVTT